MYVCGSIIIISTLPLPHLPSDISHCLDCFIDLSFIGNPIVFEQRKNGIRMPLLIN